MLVFHVDSAPFSSLFLLAMKLRPREVNDSPQATAGCWRGWDPAQALGSACTNNKQGPAAPRAGGVLHVSPGRRPSRDLVAPHLARWGAAKGSRPSCRAARPACSRLASTSCPPPSADSKLFGKLAPNPPPSGSKASLGYLVVFL